jgi:hypothetical protein
MINHKIISNWLGSDCLNVFVTVTLKKSIWIENTKGEYILAPIAGEHVRKVGWLIRDRVSKMTYGTRAFKNKKVPPFLVFTEYDSSDRPHLHIIASMPSFMDENEYNANFRSIANKIDWVYNQIDIRPIAKNEVSKVIRYSLKSGFEAFIPEASFIPSIA